MPANTSVSYRLENVYKRFPGILAVNDVNMEVRNGEIHGIIGKNGAGKSVTVSTIAGIHKATSGVMWVGDRQVNLTSFSPGEAHDLGISLIPQEPLIYLDLSVTDNIFMGYPLRNKLGFLDHNTMRKKTVEIAEHMTVKCSPRQKMKELRLEDQQLLAFGRALFIEEARVILLDEITASLSRRRKDMLLQYLREMVTSSDHLSFTLITHHIDEVIAFCDRVTVMRDGSAIQTLTVADTTKAELAALIVGDTAPALKPNGSGEPLIDNDSALPPEAGPEANQPVLTVESLVKHPLVDDISFEIQPGEVLGMAGLDGSGKETTLEILAGLTKLDEGTITVAGKKVRIRNPRDAFRNRIAYLPKKREEQAVIHNRSVQENTLLCIYSSLKTPWQLIDHSRARKLAQQKSQELQVKTVSLSTNIDNLSGGNRQKVIINRVSLTQPLVFILNEPTRGVDLATKPEILKMVRTELAKTASIIVTSESEEELVEVCDRILIFYRGKIRRILTRGQESFNVAEVYKSIQGVLPS